MTKHYRQSRKQFNGKPAWKTADKAIWYYGDSWVLGYEEAIGTDQIEIKSIPGGENNCPVPNMRVFKK